MIPRQTKITLRQYSLNTKLVKATIGSYLANRLGSQSTNFDEQQLLPVKNGIIEIDLERINAGLKI
jgi:hypothetical protein